MSSSNEETMGKTSSTEKNIVKQKISRPKELILLFWIDEEDKNGGYDGRTLFSEAAQTRMENIKKSSWYNEKIHKVHNPPIQAIHEIGPIINNWTSKYGGKDKIKTREIGVFSHAAGDGPISYHTANIPPVTGWPVQMAITGGWDAIDFNWKEQGAICVFYGCNTGHNPEGFAHSLSKLSNFSGVTVWGQSTSAFPSFYPNYRVTTVARSAADGFFPNIVRKTAQTTWDLMGPTYMVGGNSGEGVKSTYIFGSLTNSVNQLTDEELKSYPPANVLKYFQNGNYEGQTHQGVFNDHRKTN
ncbi:hypothetical protein MTZ49_15355 [Entomomonas sp. E2T0]|uniref:hypothetical protein n=1 Tax=Entomomonas sp. E2T0 TaxID=2930213 RepID=UPI0022281E3C|nr:hypothetical protein [Entomomonas sp. E2T0]UYZ83947.1 hypothetical protein MTZ49_15355 [Entomomonas sp. E2T0]